MVNRCALTVLLVASALPLSCGSGVGNSSPRLATIPNQSTTTSSTFSLDLASYVTDNAGGLTFDVVSGGGAFAGSTYSRQFPTLGTYTVQYQVADAGGKVSTGSFTVRVTQATLVVVQRGTNLSLWETTTGELTEASSSQGRTDTFKAVTAKGQVVYERAYGGQYDLYLYDPNVPATRTLGDSATVNERYAGKTSTDKILFTKGTTTSRDLYLYDPATNTTETIAANSNEDEAEVFVNSSDLIFYQRGSGGQYDIYYFDLEREESVAVSTNTNNEVIRAVLPDGGIVFSRVGAGGELDLFYFRRGVGVVEIGADREATIGALNKAYAGRTSQSRVVFSTFNGSQYDLYLWNPATGQTAVVANSSADETLAAVTAGDKLIINIATSPTNNDLARYAPATGTTTTIANTADNEVFNAVLSDGDVVFTAETGTGKDVFRWDDATNAVIASLTAGASDYVFRAALSGDKVVVENATSGLLLLTASGSTTVTGDTTARYRGETSGGDFVYSRTTASQDDLYLWDESGSSSVAISTNAAHESFQLGLTDGRVLYARTNTDTTTDLFVWSPGTGNSTQVTTTAESDAAVTVFTGSNP